MAKFKEGHGSAKQFPRMARVSELCREIIAEELERLSDDRLPFVTVTHVEIDPDLRHGRVFWSSLGSDDESASVSEVLEEHRRRLQGAIARQARLKRTPELSFRLDPMVASSSRIDELLRDERERRHKGETDR